jgi:hypothetical protein
MTNLLVYPRYSQRYSYIKHKKYLSPVIFQFHLADMAFLVKLRGNFVLYFTHG